MPQFVDDFFLIIPPAAIERWYSPAKFDCPDAPTLSNRFACRFCAARLVGSQKLHGGTPAHGSEPANARLTAPEGAENPAREAADADDRSRGDLFWTEIALHCAASIAARGPRAACGALRSVPDLAANAHFTVVTEFTN